VHKIERCDPDFMAHPHQQLRAPWPPRPRRSGPLVLVRPSPHCAIQLQSKRSPHLVQPAGIDCVGMHSDNHGQFIYRQLGNTGRHTCKLNACLTRLRLPLA
jgi:hypothetical protein